MRRLALFASFFMLLAFAPLASSTSVCVEDDGESTCVVADSYGHGSGPCDGYAYNGGNVGVSQSSQSGGTNRFAGVSNGCYSSTDPQGNAYQGTTIGAYVYESGPNGWSSEGFHLNTGEHSVYGPYCFLGEPDSVDPTGVNCPTIVRVPMILNALP